MSVTAPPDLLVDCYGSSYRPEYMVNAYGIRTRFVFAPTLKVGREFSLAIFLDDAAFSRACYRYPRSRRLGLLLESPLRGYQHRQRELRARYDYVCTFYEELLALGPPFIPFYFGTSWIKTQLGTADLTKRRLFSFVGSIQHGRQAGYELRAQIAQCLLADRRVDCFGKGIREIASKLEGLAHYAFSVAMENVRYDGYFTEKLIDCFLTDTVPVYWGGAVERWFDERGILRFETSDQLSSLLDALNWELYARMLPFVRRNAEIAQERALDSMQGVYQRLGEVIRDHGLPISPVSAFLTTKPFAALRLLTARIGLL